MKVLLGSFLLLAVGVLCAIFRVNPLTLGDLPPSRLDDSITTLGKVDDKNPPDNL